ncbi:MAG: hypothetical protein KKE52_11755, partial [Alphaproteobacteria bacterium]|nr:hypothetical protein [Alphaproteobacteria bacterium]
MLSSGRRRHGLTAVAGSVGLHLALLAGVVLMRPPEPPPVPAQTPRPPVEVTLFRPPPPPPPLPAPEQRAEA